MNSLTLSSNQDYELMNIDLSSLKLISIGDYSFQNCRSLTLIGLIFVKNNNIDLPNLEKIDLGYVSFNKTTGIQFKSSYFV